MELSLLDRLIKLWRVNQINWIISGPSADLLTQEERWALYDERAKLYLELEKREKDRDGSVR